MQPPQFHVHHFGPLGDDGLVVTLIAVELSVCTGLRGCDHPMSMRVWRWGTILCAAMNNAASSASAAKAMTNLMIVAMVNTAPLKRGIGSSSER